MAYTYEDFLSRAKKAGLLEEFSEYDLAVAKEHPEFGLSILALKQDVHNATTQEAKLLAHATAEDLRRRYGSYSGGSQGADYLALTPDRESTLTALANYPAFSYSRSGMLSGALAGLSDAEPFTYDPNEDPVYASYRKQYLREGERAAENALAKASAATLGVPSSYAVTAASQAEDAYAGKLADKIPELYRDAYARYADEQDRRADLVKLLLSDRGAEADAESEAFDRLKAAANAADAVGDAADNAAKERQKLAAKQVDAILSLGEMPPKELIEASGYSEEYIRLMLARYRR